MNAVIYARYSSSSQREETIEVQIRECTKFAEENGYDKLLLTFNFKDGTRTITFNDVKAATSKSGSDLDCSLAPKKTVALLGSCLFYCGGGLEEGGLAVRQGKKVSGGHFFSPG